MRLLDRYIGRSVVNAILLITVILLGLEIFIIFIGELGDIGQGNYGVGQAFIYSLLNLPLQMYGLFPIASLIGGLVGLGMLATHSELMVMRAAGVSTRQLVMAVLKMAIMLVIVVAVFCEVFGPWGAKYAESIKSTAMSGGQTYQTQHGVWVRNGDDFININEVGPGRVLRGVTTYAFAPSGKLLTATYAKTAVYYNDNWLLENIRTSTFTDKGVKVSYQTSGNWSVKLLPTMVRTNLLEPAQMSLWRLHQYIKYQKANGLQDNDYALAFWQRILQPFSTAVMILLAIPFIFGPLRTVTMGLRILVGVIFGFGFYLLNRFFGPVSLVYQVPPFLAATIPTILFFVIAVLMMRKAK